MRRAFSVLLLPLQLFFVAQATAQTSQYVGPGELAVATSSTRERVLQGAENARWKYGRWRLNPLFSIRDVGYQDNVFGAAESEGPISDFHAAAGVGLDSYLALSRKVYLAAFAAPEYTYWNKLDQLRQLNVNYGAGLFGYFNRLVLGFHGRSIERESPLTSEVETPVQISEEAGTLDVRLELRPSLFLIGSASSVAFRHSRDLEELIGIDPLALDRDEERFRGAVTIRFRNNFELGLGLEDENVDFRTRPELRSYSGTSPLLTASMDGHRLQIEARIVQRQLQSADSSLLDSFEETTGRFRISAEIARATRLSTYGSRNLVFSALDTSGFLVEDRWGLLLARDLGRRLSAEAFVETGFLDFESPEPGRGLREDDVEGYGASLGLELSDTTQLRVFFSEVRYESNLAGADRQISRVGAALSLGDSLIPW